MRKNRVLVVDDSASMRQLISAVLNAEPDLEVVGHAADPLEARQAIKDLSPDVLTLDVEMPNMSGIDFLERLMRLRPTPVIMVSSLTPRGGEITTRALEIGAVDCVTKPGLGELRPFGDLADKVRMAAGVRMQPGSPASGRGAPATASAGPAAAYAPNGRIVAIGSSTGGVEALTAVLTTLPADCAPVVVTQHMPPLFTRSFSERLDKLCLATVAEATDGAPLLPGRIYIAPGGHQHLEVTGRAGPRGAGPPRCRLREGPPVNGHCPSVDVLFRSVVKAAGGDAVGVILTGMGRDGADGLLAMRNAGAATLGQDAASSLIYGMPKVAFEIGAVDRQLPLRRIGAEIASLTNKLDRT
ncbi:protein-glutamate methylesterase/protein-glutamine glutaminase [Lichenibacterium ramalinae]|uniref:Protein-glutamate methylesterase/protein-glutamine glutaminase n=1 Tax=Lichenibacterium ramalinae TaxID=2316527 RepID=A0A4V1RIA9_9HYPH|nr:chemotaxis response regulator protein-glutamate methylesterase [Lichenibacterium ramalinae]RYB03071.1 chemotaxis response regulator protein-glutamate methylesterase [Lichenibacterium ramalinae]